MPRVSICIPTYNRGRLVSRTIDSVLSQSETDIELVLLDDASTDDTLEVAASYRDPRFRVEQTQRHLGLGGNLNRCLEVAQAPYVKILGDDNLLYPNAISELAGALDRFPDATLATSAWNWINTEGSLLATTRLLKRAPPDGTLVGLRQIVTTSWLCRNRIGGPSAVLLRRDALVGLHFNPKYAQMMDWDLWLRLLNRGPLAYLPEVLCALRMHDESLTARNRPFAQSARDLLHISSDLAASLPELRGAVSRFALRRLQLLCFLRASQLAVHNFVRRDWQAIAQNVSVAKRALGMLASPMTRRAGDEA